MNNETTINTNVTNTTTAATAPTAEAPVAAPPVALTIDTQPREQAAYQAMLAQARALDPKELLQLNLDVGTVVTTCVGVAHRMMKDRGFLSALKDFDIVALDGLETAALGLTVAQAQYIRATTPPDSLPDLVDRGTKLRHSFETWSTSLADAGLVNAKEYASIPTTTGYRDLAFALTTYVVSFRSADWVRIKAKSVLTDEMLIEAETISQQILGLVGDRDLSPAKVAEAADIRQRMFTICVRRYDQVRRAATYMRWDQGDVDEVVPSLYVKGPRSQSTKAAPAAGTAPAAPAAPVAQPASGSATAHAAPVAAHAAAGTPAAPAASGEVGMPNSSPFLAG
jgi:hypothetical protein